MKCITSIKKTPHACELHEIIHASLANFLQVLRFAALLGKNLFTTARFDFHDVFGNSWLFPHGRPSKWFFLQSNTVGSRDPRHCRVCSDCCAVKRVNLLGLTTGGVNLHLDRQVECLLNLQLNGRPSRKSADRSVYGLYGGAWF